MVAVQIIFWVCIVLLIHSYVLYPLILKVLSSNKKINKTLYSLEDTLPTISILLAAYNEERVIEEKIVSTFNTSYPLDKIQFLIGSDASSDDTDSIIARFQKKFNQIQLHPFKGRTGKPGIINTLAKEASGDIFIITDANVFFTENTLIELVKHFKNNEIGLVGGNILNYRVKRDGISVQERTYLKAENFIKYEEGVIWGSMMGTFGGVYAIRGNCYEAVPSNFLVDDFYISMAVLEKNKKAINELDAIAYEDVSNQLKEEFRRKSRISAGNFQNLARFKKLLWHPFKGRSFAFLSHKVLRWIGPFFIIIALTCSGILMKQHWFYILAFCGQLTLFLIPLFDSILKKQKIHISVIRFVSHFYLMNLALLLGFFKYVSGVKNNIWTPTQRYQ